MYRSVLVPLDGSRFGEQALPLALSVARRSGAGLLLAHVQVLPALMYTETRYNVENTLDARAREQARGYLDGVVKRLAETAGVPVSGVFLEGGVADALHEYIKGHGVDLVVMTTHGRGPLSRFWLGSVADELARRAPAPLLLIRPREAPADPGREAVLRHVLVPLDGTELAEQILKPVVALGRLMQADFTLFRAVPPLLFTASDPTASLLGVEYLPSLQQLRAEADTYLEGVAGRLRAEGLTVRTQVVINQQPAAAILEAARSQQIDLVALESHGSRGLTRLLMGSVADKVVRGSTAPVLVHSPAGRP
jgi:nucleotide-binding universal stress UspA family protein